MSSPSHDRLPVPLDRQAFALLAAVAAASTLFLVVTACNRVAVKGLDQTDRLGTERGALPAIVVPEGFRAVRHAEGFNYPSSVAWDATGTMYVLESRMVPVPTLEPRILRVVPGAEIEEVALEGPDAPTGHAAIGLTFHDGWLLFSHEQADGTWGVSRVRPQGGRVEAVVRAMPGNGDHNVNYLAVDAAGTLYFGVGSATNSGVVSSHDPVNKKWLGKRPAVRDLPCRDLVLTGSAFTDLDETTKSPDDEATTGAFQAYRASKERRVAAAAPCTSAMYRLPAGARQPELVAWGFRNPVAVAIAPDGTVLVGAHGADVRGTRPILDDPDAIYRLREGAWYGWPDFSGALVPYTDPRYQPPASSMPEGHDRVRSLIDLQASGLEPPSASLLVTTTEPHAAIGGMTVVPAGGPFARFAGKLLISEMGDFKPTTDPREPETRAGFQVEMVDLATGVREPFARNRGSGNAQPASELDLEDGFERPVDVKVGPDGNVCAISTDGSLGAADAVACFLLLSWREKEVRNGNHLADSLDRAAGRRTALLALQQELGLRAQRRARPRRRDHPHPRPHGADLTRLSPFQGGKSRGFRGQATDFRAGGATYLRMKAISFLDRKAACALVDDHDEGVRHREHLQFSMISAHARPNCSLQSGA